MLPRSRRLNLKKDFKWVASGIRIEGKLITLFIRKGENKFPLIGIAVSSRYFKKAVERNRAKRLISAAIERLYTKLPFNINIVALPKSSILGVKSNDAALELKQLLKI